MTADGQQGNGGLGQAPKANRRNNTTDRLTEALKSDHLRVHLTLDRPNQPKVIHIDDRCSLLPAGRCCNDAGASRGITRRSGERSNAAAVKGRLPNRAPCSGLRSGDPMPMSPRSSLRGAWQRRPSEFCAASSDAVCVCFKRLRNRRDIFCLGFRIFLSLFSRAITLRYDA